MLFNITVILQQLSDEQVLQLSLLTLLIVQGFKIVYVGALKRPKPSKGTMRLFVFVVSIPIGYFYSEVELPALEDPMKFAQGILLLASGVLIWSGLAYEYIMNGVLGFLDKPIAKRLGRPLLEP